MKLVPSQFLPNYLATDLGVGGPAPHSLVQALDAVVTAQAARTMGETHRLTPQHWKTETFRRFLESFGFSVQRLPERHIAPLAQALPQWLKDRLTARPVAALSAMYFETATIQRTPPAPQNRLLPTQGRYRLGTQESALREICVLVPAGTSPATQKEFLQNAQRLLPAGKSVRIVEVPVPVDAPPRGIRLDGRTRFLKRRW